MSSSMTTNEHISKPIATSDMKIRAKLVDVMSKFILDITNFVRSHMKFIS